MISRNCSVLGRAMISQRILSVKLNVPELKIVKRKIFDEVLVGY